MGAIRLNGPRLDVNHKTIGSGLCLNANAAGQSWLGVEATDLSFSLNFEPLDLAVTDGSLLLNQAPTGEVLQDWSFNRPG